MRDKKEQLYYIQDSRGFHHNALIWWGIDGGGYTSDIQRAGKYGREEAARIVNGRDSDIAWPCDYIDKNEKSKKIIIDGQSLDYAKRKKRMKPTPSLLKKD